MKLFLGFASEQPTGDTRPPAAFNLADLLHMRHSSWMVIENGMSDNVNDIMESINLMPKIENRQS